MKRSTDLGQSWGTLQVIIDNGPDTAGNPAPVFDRSTGRLWLPYCTNPAEDPYDRDVWITYSDDFGDTWAEPKKLTDDVKPSDWIWYATGPGRSIQLSTGRLIVPANHSLEGNIRRSHVFFRITTAKLGKLRCVEPATDESQIAELSDGTVVMNTRIPDEITYVGLHYQATEARAGTTSIRRNLTDPMCQGSIINTEQGLVFSNPATQEPFPRDHMTVRLSLDEGATWPMEGNRRRTFRIFCSGRITRRPVWTSRESGELYPYETIRFAAFELGSKPVI